MSLSLYLQNELLNWFKGNSFLAPPTNTFLSLYNGNPYVSGTEITTSIRSAGRVPITYGVVQDHTSGREIVNSAEVSFGNSESGSTLTASYFAIYDDAISGNILIADTLSSSQEINQNDPIKFEIGNLKVKIEGETN